MSDLQEQDITTLENILEPELVSRETQTPAILDATIKEVMRGDLNSSVYQHYLYLVKDKTTIFYVGQSTNPLIRLKEHMGLRRFEESNLGLLIFCNLPESLEWRMQLLTLLGCEQFIRSYLEVMYQRQVNIAEIRGKALPENLIPPSDALELYKLYASGSRQHVRIARNIAEKALIAYYKPCLNSAYNHTPTPFPANVIHPVRLSTVPYLHPFPYEYLIDLINSNFQIDQAQHRSMILEAWKKESG